MFFGNGAYRTNINKPLKHEQTCSLLNSLSYLFKILPRDFEISTNNGHYFFNKEISCTIIPIISEAAKKDKNISQYRFDIDDEFNIMKKIESLFKGEPVDFSFSEIDEINKIIKLFTDGILIISLMQESQEQISLKINLKFLFELLQQKLDKPFKIKTKKKEYICNTLGITVSNSILTFLKSNPNSTEFYFDFPDEHSEFQLISDYFNFNEINITSDIIDSLQIISEQLEITPLIEIITKTYDKYDENFQKSEENQKIIDPYSELFECLFNINQIGIEKVSEFILESTWVNSESEVQELVACFLVVINSDISIQKEILDLIILLSEKQDEIKELSILIPFLTDKILKKNINSNHTLSFMYYLYRKNIVSIETILKKVSSQFPNFEKTIIRNQILRNQNNNLFVFDNKNIITWFYPELIETKLISEKLQLKIQNEIPYVNSNTITVEQMKESRENYVEKDSIILAIRNDDVDTLQSIITTTGIDIQTKKIHMSIYENFSGDLSFIDYAAGCGSIKCFKYLYLNKASIDYNTFYLSILGKNVEIIRIIDQNKADFNPLNRSNYSLMPEVQNQLILVFNAAIEKHEYRIFDWLFEQNNFDSEKELFVLLKKSIQCGNAYAMLEIIQKIANLNNLADVELYDIIKTSCSSGFYQILKFLTHLINLHDLTDPTKGDHSDLTDVSNRRIKIKNLNTQLLKSSVNFGMNSIFSLIMKETGITNSKCLFEALIEAAQTNNLNIIKYILENNLYQLSDLFKMKIISCSILADSQDVTNYFFEKEIIANSEFLESACSAQNIELVKLLVQTANEKHISLVFTQAFINAVSSYSDEICRYIIEMKVSFNYQKIFQSFYNIISINPQIIILLIENANDEIKDDLISQSIKAAFQSRTPQIFEYLFTKKINLNGLLVHSIYESDLETVKTILEYNHSPEFINQIGPDGTPLHVAINQHKNDIVEYLLQLPGIDPSISIDLINTPLVEAVKSNNPQSLELILKFYGDSIKDQGYQIHNAFKQILKRQANRNNSDENYNLNYLNFGHHMINRPESEKLIFEQLLDIKEKVNPFNMVEEDLLSYAIIEKDESSVDKILKFKSTNLKQKLQFGNTYLHIAIDGQELTSIQKLLINHPDIDINSQNALSETPLTKAVLNKNIELIEMILAHPKFDPKLSLLDSAFDISIPFKDISRRLLKVDSIDVNYHSTDIDDQQLITTPLMRAIKINDIELAELIIQHPSFDPSRSKIKSCLFNSVNCRNLDLFRFLLKMNGNEINIRDDKNVSLLGCAALIKNNEEILNEILNNENFDPVKSDIQTSFLNSNNRKAMQILISYDEKHGNYISLDKIELRIQLKNEQLYRPNNFHSLQYLLRKKEIVPKIHPICTSIISKHCRLRQQMYKCNTCEIEGICEICAKVCHIDHEIEIMKNNISSRNLCNCSRIDHQCKCRSIQSCSDDDEIYDNLEYKEAENDDDDDYNNNRNQYINPMRLINNYNLNNNNYDEYEEEDDDLLYININKNDEDHSFDCLRCSLDLSSFRPILQIMYRCTKCQIDICQNCAIRCHKGHALIYKGLVPDSLCYCKDVNDCKCTDRKTVICNYSFYGSEYIYQPWFTCTSCGTSGGRGCCAVCSKKCHKGHKVHSNGISSAFCDCGPTDLGNFCQCMKFPPFNYLNCCTNRNQNYTIQQQRLYHCFTCGITSENQGICESCAIHCHYGHKVVFVKVCSFACECATVDMYNEKIHCIASFCPEMNNSGRCSRKNKNSDAIFAKFICLTCDKEGKKNFCEACAVKCHMNHDVHLVEFSNFECQCENCKCIENDST